MTMLQHKICSNCGATMTFDNLKMQWICLMCGNSEEVENRKDLYSKGYIG